MVEQASARGVTELVLTDINNTSCAFQFINACKQYKIKPILGIEYRRDNQFLYLGIARNEEGWRELCAHLTEHSLENKDLLDIAPDWKNAYTIYRKLPKGITMLHDNEYVGVRPGEVNHLYSSYLKSHLDKLVIFSPLTFLDRDGFRIHKMLRCIDLNIIVSKLKPEHHARSGEIFQPDGRIEKIYGQYPKVIVNTQKILDDCTFDMTNDYRHNRISFTGSAKDDISLLSKLAINGCISRFGKKNKKAMVRTLNELKVIDKLKFSTYFLITWDIIRYAHSVGYHHIGRGSGANSIVAFNINITDVDPLELDLYFERFINPHRTSPPDFDIDFSWDQRDDVTDYVFNRYGKSYTALLATYNTFKGKSIIRELGKVFGLPKADIDIIVNQPHATDKHHHFAKHIFKYGKMIEGFPNYLSIHAGGVLISERPLNYHTALQMMPKGFPIVHFDMYGAEDIGYHKYDILSQRGLGHIKDSVALIARNQGKTVDIHKVDMIKNDAKVKAQLKSGKCIGCFYIESPAMRGLLTKLSCDNYIHLVAASSIIRPGVAKSGMMREYINRAHNPDSFTYIHPVFEEYLGETYGVMVYQEDVMKIVHHFSGLDLTESDVLRRIMTGKRKNSDTFEKLKIKYFKNCKEKGYPDDLAMEVWRQIASFSGYSFCKAHSASFAVESFQSLYLKTYYPLEFMTAVINNFGGFYRTEVYVHEARMCGAIIEPPCVNNSTYLTSIDGITIYIGFIHIADLERKLAIRIVDERITHGDFRDLNDFVHRVDISKEQLEILIRIGGFRFSGMNKYQLMWEKNAVHNPAVKQAQYATFFDIETPDYDLPILEEGKHEQAFDEIELLGFSLCSPFDLLDGAVSATVTNRELLSSLGNHVSILGYYVARKHVTTVNKRHMSFGTWLDIEGAFFDTVHFPQSLARYPFRGRGCYLLKGKIVEDFGFPSIEVYSMERLPYVKDDRY